METIAFYSYKGGVGRSLLLANAARFLATLGKGVVAVDLDFEAPGLHYKLDVPLSKQSGTGGAVPYLLGTAEGAVSPPSLESHMVSLAVPPGTEGWLRLLPAGAAPEQTYWRAFKDLGEKLHLGDASGQGFMALLDLQARIEDELKPDYLLIDARTGVTELGGLATTALADTVVCLFVGNQESLDGTLAVVEALTAAPRLKKQRRIRAVPVLARTVDEPPEDVRFVQGTKRLLELGEGKKSEGKGEESTLHALPHDAVFGNSERIVGGDRQASAFSPLYKAYLELFESLFPSAGESTREVLERLESVAEIKEQLTSKRERDDGLKLSPWSESAIQEGVVVPAERYGRKKEGEGRYADLVCLSESAGMPLMIVEYVGEQGPDVALKYWGDNSNLRCVVLLSRSDAGYVEKKIFSRGVGSSSFNKVERWELPRPREFELLRDLGDRSVEGMLDALRKGYWEAAGWLVNQWRESMIGVSMRGPQWRPDHARRILNGLAAIEDKRCADEILLRARPRYFDRRPHDHLVEMGGGDLERRMGQELYAPLFWRLPVEAALESLRPRRHPEEKPPLDGFRLLAEEVMGLQYDPERSALLEAREMAARLGQTRDQSEDGEEILRWAVWNRRGRMEGMRLSDEIPPVLVWEELVREKPYRFGTLEAARGAVEDKLTEMSDSPTIVRKRLRALSERRELVTQGLLGNYDASGNLVLFPLVIGACAEVLGVSARYLKSVAFIHVATRAMAHEARDLDGHRGYGFAPSTQSHFLIADSPAHVSVVQAFVDRLIQRLGDPNLRAVFESLSKHQPESYGGWRAMRNTPMERLRTLLLRARGSGSALGLMEDGD